jgi:NADH-quinone oxidoreductase subunit M
MVEGLANTTLLFLIWPALSGFVLFCFGKKYKAAQWANLLFNVIWLGFFLQLWALKPQTDAPFPVVFYWNWLPFLKSHFSLGLDGLNLPLMALTVFLSVCLAFYSLGKKKLGSGYLALFSILNAASVGSLMAADAFAFYVFWEFMLIPMYLLIGRWGSQNRVYASLKFFAFTMGGSLLMLAAILALAYIVNVPSLEWIDIRNNRASFEGGWSSLQGLIFFGFLAAFAVKIPIWPLHTWLPDAHTEAPTGASVILAGVLLKLGVYGIARWCLPLFPDAALAAAPVMMTLGCIGIVMGAFAAWFQTDIKRIIAYSSVSHLGFMVLGLFALNEEGLHGAMFQNLAHGLSTGALFLIFGVIYERTHTRDIAKYGGLAQRSAWLSSLFVFSCMASVALPGLPGFIGEFLILNGAFMSHKVFALVALSGVLLGAIYTLSLVRRMIFGPVNPYVEEHPVRPSWNEWVAIVPFVIAMLLLGLAPQSILLNAASGVANALAR